MVDTVPCSLERLPRELRQEIVKDLLSPTPQFLWSNDEKMKHETIVKFWSCPPNNEARFMSIPDNEIHKKFISVLALAISSPIMAGDIHSVLKKLTTKIGFNFTKLSQDNPSDIMVRNREVYLEICPNYVKNCSIVRIWSEAGVWGDPEMNRDILIARIATHEVLSLNGALNRVRRGRIAIKQGQIH